VYVCRFHYAKIPLYWRQETELQKRNEAFVALTRTKIWCVITGVKSENSIFDELQKIIEQYPYLVFPAFNQSSPSLQRVNDENE
ncbi:hypothetical protein, partial [Klebsiella pneumoniae]|uniref:hypothetical protein n=1 Tax=Klebsiella pneumoniae TaxID=573 RepID=UPI0027316FE4